MSEEVTAGPAETVLKTVFARAAAATVVCTEPTLLAAGVAALDAVDDETRPTVRFITPQRVAKQTRDDFVTATTLVEFEEAETVELRVVEAETALEPAVVTDGAVFCLLQAIPERIVAVRITDTQLQTDYGNAVDAQWDDAAPFDLETFARSRLLDGLEEAFGRAFREDFELAMTVPSVRGANHIDPVDLLVLFAAKHGKQSYELNRWGESFGVASVGKFSQSKRALEDLGLVDTEKVESGTVGRPRQRLVLRKPGLADATPAELVAALQSAPE